VTIGELLRRARSFLRRDQLAEDLEEEMRLHVELRARATQKYEGGSEERARQAAQRQFGNQTQWKETSRDMWGWNSLETLQQDVTYAMRMLRKTPIFTIVSVLTLTLGIGMNTAVFSVVDAVMLRGLPYHDADRLVSLWEEVNGREDPATMSSSGARGRSAGRGGAKQLSISPANMPDYRGTKVFANLAEYDLTQMNLTGSGEPARLYCQRITERFFDVLQVSPARGRLPGADDLKPGADEVAVIADGLWKRRFGQDPALLGATILLDSRPHRVIGILPEGFESPSQYQLKDPIDFYVPVSLPQSMLTNRGEHLMQSVGRLADGHTVKSAQAALDTVSSALSAQFPATNRNLRASIAPLRDDITSSVRTPLFVMLGAVGFVVLIACINVANLLLVRALARRKETSVRFALGATRLRIVREFLVESLTLSLLGCAAGLLFGSWLLRWLIALAPANIPRLNQAHLDWRVFTVSAALATATGILFGCIPAWQASQAKPVDALRGHGQSGGSQTLRWRSALTIVEIALSMVLLIGAGLLLRSFAGIAGVDLGFQPERVLAMSINLPDARYGTAAERLRFFETLEARVRTLPGVNGVAFANRMPLRGGWSSGFTFPDAPDRTHEADFQAVSTGYFETIGLQLVAGRAIRAEDRTGQPAVAVVNLAFSRRLLGGKAALGERFRRGPQAPWITVVGVVNDIRRGGKTEDMRPQVYLPAAQTEIYPVRLADFAIRSSGDPRSLAKSIQTEVVALDKDQPVTAVRTLDEIVTASLAQRRFQLMLLLLFAAAALGLALIGVFGVVAHVVEQRTPELGIRLALGANPGSVMRMILMQAGILVGVGLATGIGGALAFSRSMESLLFGVTATDWRTYTIATLMLALVSLAASAIPARRASRVDPLIAIRYE